MTTPSDKADFGKYGNKNRKFLAGIYKPKPDEVFMRLSPPINVTLPSKYDLRTFVGNIEIYNQGSIGSCTAQAIAYAYKIMSIRKNRRPVSISRLFVYYNVRKMIGKVNEDSGGYIKDGFASMQKEGACLERFWPYVESWFTRTPSFGCYQEARNHRVSRYNSQLDPRNMVQSIKQCIALGLPVVIGVMVYESFQSKQTAKTGYIPIPNPLIEPLMGGHAMCVVGYDDEKQHFIVVNSWSEAWGDKGYCYIPYAFIANNDLCNDCHAFMEVELRLLGDDTEVPEDIFRCSTNLVNNCELC